MIDDCEKRESKLTDWDVNFLDSISNQLDKNRSLSQKQIEKLESIWEKATKHG